MCIKAVLDEEIWEMNYVKFKVVLKAVKLLHKHTHTVGTLAKKDVCTQDSTSSKHS